MKYFAPLAIAALVIGCGQEPQATPQPAATVQTAESTAPTASMASAACVPGYSPLPEGLALATPLHLRVDRIETNPQGNMRRVVALEFLSGTEDEALALVEAGMTAIGFTGGEWRSDAKGHPLLSFTKPDFGTVHVVATPVPEQGANNPSAQGVLIINAPFEGDPALGTFAVR